MKILMIVTVIFDKKYCNNNSNNRCTFFIELPVSVHDFTNHIYDHNIDNDITEYVNEEAQIDETVIINIYIYICMWKGTFGELFYSLSYEGEDFTKIHLIFT
jgi:hypothetical protein